MSDYPIGASGCPEWSSPDGQHRIIWGDCIAVLPLLDTSEVAAVVTDPPFGVRGDSWDDMDDQEFCRFSMQWLALSRAITPRLIAFFASGKPFMDLCKYIYPRVRQLIWNKPLGSQYAGSSDCRMWYAYEPIVHCWEQEKWEVVQPKNLEVAAMIKTARERKGLSRGGVDMVVRGKKTGLCFRWEEAACIPTPEQAEQLKGLLDLDGVFSSALERAYSARDDVLDKMSDKSSGNAAAMADVFTYRTLTGGVHPCEKPIELLADIIEATTNEGETLADPFAGSCTVAVACARTGRRSISIEIEERYFRIGIERMEREAARQPLLDAAERRTQRSLLP